MKHLTIALMLMIGALTCNDAAAKTIKIATTAPKDSPWYVALKNMAQSWDRVSQGRIRVIVYPGYGKEPYLVQKMRSGILHGATLTGQDGLRHITPEMGIFSTPMLIKSDSELDFLRDKMGPELRATMIEKGFRVLGWSDIGWVYFFSKSPVRGPDDARSLRIRVGPDDTAWIELLKDNGYRPTPLPITEIHTGLESGFIDGFAAPPVMALASQWFALAKHMTDLKWAPLTGALVISDRTWREIPADLRPLLAIEAEQAARNALREIRGFEAGAITAMKRYGLQVHELETGVADAWIREVTEAYPSIVGSSVPAPIYERASDLLAEYRQTQKSLVGNPKLASDRSGSGP